MTLPPRLPAATPGLADVLAHGLAKHLGPLELVRLRATATALRDLVDARPSAQVRADARRLGIVLPPAVPSLPPPPGLAALAREQLRHQKLHQGQARAVVTLRPGWPMQPRSWRHTTTLVASGDLTAWSLRGCSPEADRVAALLPAGSLAPLPAGTGAGAAPRGRGRGRESETSDDGQYELFIGEAGTTQDAFTLAAARDSDAAPAVVLAAGMRAEDLTHVRWAPDSRHVLLLFARPDGPTRATAMLFDVEGACRATMISDSPFEAVQWGGGGGALCLSSATSTQIWATATGQRLRTFLPTAQVLFEGAAANLLVADDGQLRRLPLAGDSEVLAADWDDSQEVLDALAPDGSWLALAGDEVVRIVATAAPTVPTAEIAVAPGWAYLIGCTRPLLALAPATEVEAGTLIDAATGAALPLALPAPRTISASDAGRPRWSFSFSPSDRYLAVTGHAELKIFCTRTGRTLLQQATPVAGGPGRIRWSSDEARLHANNTLVLLVDPPAPPAVVRGRDLWRALLTDRLLWMSVGTSALLAVYVGAVASLTATAVPLGVLLGVTLIYAVLAYVGLCLVLGTRTMAPGLAILRLLGRSPFVQQARR